MDLEAEETQASAVLSQWAVHSLTSRLPSVTLLLLSPQCLEASPQSVDMKRNGCVTVAFGNA
jgi:hypothetical protein